MNPNSQSSAGPDWPAAKNLVFDAEVRARTDAVYEKVRDVVPEPEWPLHAPLVDAINRLKRERNAVILAHNYMTPEIFHCVGDAVGDSLKLAQLAAESEADIIVQAGVHFMAETAKILSPDKTVLIPDLRAGCSLAASITGENLRAIKRAYPGVPVVTYVNTSAEVKAESDICCTSSNAVAIVEAIAAERGVDRVILIPDEYLARNVASQTEVRILTWKGACEVHERFTAAEIRQLRVEHPEAMIITHPECTPEVLREADFAGSTAAMAGFVASHKPRTAILITECSMSDNVAVDNPGTRFIRPCNLCPHMKRITLAGIYESLRQTRYEVTVPTGVAARARAAVQAMLDLTPAGKPPAFDTHRPAMRAEYVSI
ncbi:MAG: quinolinate synthase [Gammaproteobacteria bacterium HGW-Gammaproteobacteria-8]|nr:MAG: quinolinate synthase [Gammaproteobacteria bacterium HGW-Gammaproteobacteria-8]